MGINRYFNRFWIWIPIILSAVFAILFFPLVRQQFSLIISILLTTAGMLVIWIIYLLRAVIFTSAFRGK